MLSQSTNARGTTTANVDPLTWTFGNQYPDSDEEDNNQDVAPMEDIIEALNPTNSSGRTW
jgi:hypothetical protein